MATWERTPNTTPKYNSRRETLVPSTATCKRASPCNVCWPSRTYAFKSDCACLDMVLLEVTQMLFMTPCMPASHTLHGLPGDFRVHPFPCRQVRAFRGVF